MEVVVEALVPLVVDAAPGVNVVVIVFGWSDVGLLLVVSWPPGESPDMGPEDKEVSDSINPP